MFVLIAIRVQVNQSDEYDCNGNTTRLSWDILEGSEDLTYQITFINAEESQ